MPKLSSLLATRQVPAPWQLKRIRVIRAIEGGCHPPPQPNDSASTPPAPSGGCRPISHRTATVWRRPAWKRRPISSSAIKETPDLTLADSALSLRPQGRDATAASIQKKTAARERAMTSKQSHLDARACIDETSAATKMTKLHGRSPVARCIGSARSLEDHDAGVRPFRWPDSPRHRGAMTGAAFSAYADALLGPVLGVGDIVVLDNLSAQGRGCAGGHCQDGCDAVIPAAVLASIR